MPVVAVIREPFLILGHPYRVTRLYFIEPHVVFVLVPDVGNQPTTVRSGIHAHAEKLYADSLARVIFKLAPPSALVLPCHHAVNSTPAFLSIVSVNFVQLENLTVFIPFEKLVSRDPRMSTRVILVDCLKVMQPVSSRVRCILRVLIGIPPEKTVNASTSVTRRTPWAYWARRACWTYWATGRITQCV